MKFVKDLLHEMFSDDAIVAAAIAEQDDDIRYCAERNFTDKDFIARNKKLEKCYGRDGGRTYNLENIKAFRERVNELMRKNQGTLGADMYAKANETETYAIRCLYYQSTNW